MASVGKVRFELGLGEQRTTRNLAGVMWLVGQTDPTVNELDERDERAVMGQKSVSKQRFPEHRVESIAEIMEMEMVMQSFFPKLFAERMSPITTVLRLTGFR